MATEDIVITAATRTPIGSFLGSLGSLAASSLGGRVIGAARQACGLEGGEVDEVVMGQVLTAACGQNPARQAALEAGLPQEVSAMTVNQVCGSGLCAVALAEQAIRSRARAIVIAGGQESMSLAPHAAHLRAGKKLGTLQVTDTMIHDGLWCAMNGYHMGVTAENIAKRWQIPRKEQDAFAAASQHKAEAAQAAGRFRDELTPLTVKTRKGEMVIDKDEYPRPGVTVEALAKLKPAFAPDGTVTAGNASGLNDGAAAVVVMSAREASRRNFTPLARIASWASVGVDPAVMGIGPVPASRKALAGAGWKMDEIDLIEANEAFAAQSCAVAREMGWEEGKVNVNGGAIALGHPIGASGARILVTLLYEMQRRKAAKGLATLCIGGGQGIAMCLERA